MVRCVAKFTKQWLRSRVVGVVTGAGNIPWLLLQRVGSSRGPTGGGSQALVPYSTDYVFLR